VVDTRKKKLVCFCGAGFSVPSGLPSMATFSHAVRKCATLSEDDRHDFNAVQVACSTLTAMSDASSRNLEDLASLLSVLELSQPDFKFPDSKCVKTPRDAIDLLARCIQETCHPRSHKYVTVANHLLNLCKTSELLELWIVTTNYDLSIEIAAAKNNIKVQLSDIITNACRHQEKSSMSHGTTASIYASQLSENLSGVMAIDGECHLRKLHGSVNWFRTTSGDWCAEDGWITQKQKDGIWRFSLIDSEWSVHAGADRCLVLPSGDKREALRMLQQEWRDASAAIADADAIWFIGYSFPQSDSFMRHFLAGALRENTRIRQIALIDPCATEIRQRTKHLFAAPELRDLVIPLPFCWESLTHHFDGLVNGTWEVRQSDTVVHDYVNKKEGRRIIFE
jgi:hypothetical protein